MDRYKDTLRVLVATDSHLGYLEKDEIRGQDSFMAFDEVCAIAEQKEVDFLLLGGDLFHENKPTRTTLIRTIDILRRYCLNDRPVKFQVVSDQTVNFPNRFGRVNYEDPNYNVGLPVFSIHGNHDDPAGVDNLSAIDILSSCNLLNYFGKVDLAGNGVGQITLHPILLRKGSTQVGLYGLGNIRDERLNRMFQTPHGVQWIRPANQENNPVGEWFNIFVIHQNRVKANQKNAINEHFLPRFLDFVIWGHEHECLIDPQDIGMNFHVTQPGSSVATSLIEGEAAPKHVLLLEIKGTDYRPEKIPLQSVRPFLFADVCLKDDPELDPNDQEAVVEVLNQKVESMIAEVPFKAATLKTLQMPLIRLKVDYTGFSTINAQRFGQKFVGKVANPNDILLFTKAAKARKTKEETGAVETLGMEELNQQNIEAIVAESNLRMEIIPVNDLGEALHEFVNKDEKQAFHVCVHDTLEKTQTKLTEEGNEVKEERDVIERVSLHMQHREADDMAKRAAGAATDSASLHEREMSGFRTGAAAKPSSGRTSLANFSSDDEESLRPGPGARGAPAQTKDKGKSTSTAGSVASTRAASTRAASGRGQGSRYKQTTLNLMGRGSSVQTPARTISEAPSVQVISDSEDENYIPADEPDTDVVESTSRGRKSTARGRAGRASGTRAKRGRKAANVTAIATPVASYIEDDVEDDDDYEPATKRGRGSGGTQGSRRNWGALRR